MNTLATLITTLLQLAALGLAVGTASWTLTKALIFKSMREWVDDRSQWFGDLVNCPYCASHWLAIAGVAIYRPVVMSSGLYLLDLAMSVFIVVAFASFTGGLIYRAFRSPQPVAAEEAQPVKSAPTSFLAYDK